MSEMKPWNEHTVDLADHTECDPDSSLCMSFDRVDQDHICWCVKNLGLAPVEVKLYWNKIIQTYKDQRWQIPSGSVETVMLPRVRRIVVSWRKQ